MGLSTFVWSYLLGLAIVLGGRGASQVYFGPGEENTKEALELYRWILVVAVFCLCSLAVSHIHMVQELRAKYEPRVLIATPMAEK